MSGRGRQRKNSGRGGGRGAGGQANGSSFFQHLRNAKNEDNGVGSCCLIRWMGERGSSKALGLKWGGGIKRGESNLAIVSLELLLSFWHCCKLTPQQ